MFSMYKHTKISIYHNIFNKTMQISQKRNAYFALATRALLLITINHSMLVEPSRVMK